MDRLLRHALAASLLVHGIILLARGPAPTLKPPTPPLEARLLSPEPLQETRPTPVPAPPAPTSQRLPKTEPKTLAIAAPAPANLSTVPAAPDEPPPAPAVTAAVAPLAPPPAPLEPPRFDAAYLANPPPPYPLSARRRGVEGTATVEARIGPDGEAREIRLASSAGDPALDNAALEAVRHWRFVPARQGTQAVEAWVRIPLVFRLN